MATSLDQVNTERQVAASKGAVYSADDAELAVLMGIELLTEGGGLELIKKAIDQSQDPAQVVGQFMAQLVAQLAEVLAKEYSIDPGIFLAKNGFLEQILNYIENKLGYPEEFSDQIYGQVLEIIKAAALGPEAPNNVMDPTAPQQPPQGQPVPAPQPGVAPMGGM